MYPYLYQSDLLRAFEINHAVISCFDFDTSHFEHSLFNRLNIHHPDSMAQATKKRQSEFLAGRYAAKESLKALGITIHNTAIDENRAPIWPEDVVASITHNVGTAICAAAPNSQVKFLGIDLEQIVDTETIHEIKPSIINTQEESLLRSSDLAFDTAFTLVFSAKESLFKALYYYAGRYLDFDAAELSFICTTTNSFGLTLTEDWSPEFQSGTPVHGRYHVNHDHVFTCVFEELA